MEKLKRLNRDVYIGIGLIAFSVFFLMESTKMHPGAAEFPRIILAVFLILSVFLMGNGLINTWKPERLKKSDKPIAAAELKSPVVIALVSLAYVAAIDFIGFFIATTVFVPAFMLLFGVRKLAPILIVTASIDLFIYVLFTKLLSVYLP